MPNSKDRLDDRESDFDLKSAEFVIFMPNNQLMARPRLRGRDMQPQRVFFYKRVTDNAMLILTEQEASLLTTKSSHKHILQQVGVSDGSAYRKHIQTCGVRVGERIPRSRAEEILKAAIQAELKAAKKHKALPMDESVHFDDSFPVDLRSTFVPPR
jgi:hypothetical protein